MEVYPHDTNTIEKWYLGLWQEFVEVDKNYQLWKQQRHELEIKLNVLRPVLANAGISVTDLEKKASATSQSNKDASIPASWTSQVAPIMRLENNPVHYTYVLEKLKDRGYHVPGADPRNTLLAYLSRHKKLFAKVPEKGRGYYELKR